MAERRGPWGRRILSWLFLLIFCLAAPLALVAGWARLTVIDEETYAQTVRRLADDPGVHDAVAQAVGDAAQTRLAGENPTATEALQARAAAEAIGDAARGVVASDQFRQVWEDANRNAHRLLFAGPVEGWGQTPPPGGGRLPPPGEGGSGGSQVGGGQPIVLDLSPLRDPLQAEIAGLDLDLPPDLVLEAGDLRLQLLDEQTADRIRLGVARIDLTFWAALATAVIALVLSVAFASDRLAALGRAGFGLTVAMIVLIALMLVMQTWVASAAGDEGSRLAAGAIIEAVSPLLRLAAVALALAGLLLAGIFSGLRALRGSGTRRPVME